ncbi:hypothetical protein, partial [Streptomyces gibsoniae]
VRDRREVPHGASCMLRITGTSSLTITFRQIVGFTGTVQLRGSKQPMSDGIQSLEVTQRSRTEAVVFLALKNRPAAADLSAVEDPPNDPMSTPGSRGRFREAPSWLRAFEWSAVSKCLPNGGVVEVHS